jgi:site-specific DNA-methyltransferase (adenine-specific)
LHFCNTKFGIDLINSKPDWFRHDLVWNKQRGISFLHANKMPMKSHEMIYVFSKKAPFYKRIDIPTDKKDYTRDRTDESEKDPRKNSRHYNISRHTKVVSKPSEPGKRCPLSVIDSPTKVRRSCGHPTEKPIDLYKWLIERYCPTGGTVLDPTAGSFNSVLAARELGLNAIGIEMDKKFYDAALTRLGLVPANEIVEQSQNDQP